MSIKLIGSVVPILFLFQSVDLQSQVRYIENSGVTSNSQRKKKSLTYTENGDVMISGLKNQLILGPNYVQTASFPVENYMEYDFDSTKYHPHSPDILDSLVSDKSNRRFDTVLGGITNQFLGNPGKYQSLGSGFKFDVNYSGENLIFFGLNLSLAFNDIKEDFPIESQGSQTSTFLLLLGPSVGKWYSKYNVQFNLNYALLTIGEELENGDSNIVQLNGWSPGVVFNYPLRLGRDIPHQFYEKTFRMQNYLNFCLGIRYLGYSLNEASGPMVQLGLSWRISLKGY